MTGQELIYSRLNDPAVLMDPSATDPSDQLMMSTGQGPEDIDRISPDAAHGHRENGEELSV